MVVRTWLDISHIINWRGNLSGIERVEYNLIKHYYHNTDAGFIYWDHGAQKFKEIDRSFVKKAIINRTSAGEASGRLVLPKAGLFNRFKRTGSDLSGGSIIVLVGLWDNQGYIDALARLAADNRIVHIVYDMIPLTHKKYVVDFLPPVFGDYMLRILPLCHKIMTISKSTASDVKKVLSEHKLTVPQVTPFRLGDELSRAKTSHPPAGIPQEFILSVGTVEARKNHQLLYDLQGHLQKKGWPLTPIIIVGKRGWLTDDFQATVKKSNRQITILDHASDEELRWLYEHCLFTIFPSIYEGWGLPIAESLNYGKVTLASSTSSMPEVGGKWADYFLPNSAAELARLVRKYLDPKARVNRESYIKRTYKPVSWTVAAAKFAKLASRP